MIVSQFINNKIQENNATIQALLSENKELESKKQNTSTGLRAWYNYSFESSSGLTEEYNQFYKDFSRELSKILSDKWESKFSRGHFYISGFLKNRQSGKYVYFSTEDVRGRQWQEQILIRTAKHEKDYTGGNNCFTTWEELPAKIEQL